ncbi:MAG: SRPBCC family protein [Acidimicrobiales bacterium]|nr:SRPBCC family protein [Acidimicrobiales bacterium]
MATIRREVFIDRPAEAAWALVGDPAAVTTWFPHMTSVVVDGDDRTIVLESGVPLLEKIVTQRDDLRRFQYRLTGPLPVESHLGTIDVIADGDRRCLVVYSTDVVPHALAFVLDGAVGEALAHLKTLLESDRATEAG